MPGPVIADRLGRGEIEEIAFGGRAVVVGEAARARVEAGHRELLAVLARRGGRCTGSRPARGTSPATS